MGRTRAFTPENRAPWSVAAEDAAVAVGLRDADLANLLPNQGDLAAAKELYGTVMAGWTCQLGPQQVSTLDAKMNLAIRLGKQGDLAAAIELYETVMAIYTDQLGLQHVYTIRADVARGPFENKRSSESALQDGTDQSTVLCPCL